MATANTAPTTAQPERFRVDVKTRLLERGLTVTKLAADLGYCRNGVSIAINHPTMFRQLKLRIAKHLHIHDQKRTP